MIRLPHDHILISPLEMNEILREVQDQVRDCPNRDFLFYLTDKNDQGWVLTESLIVQFGKDWIFNEQERRYVRIACDRKGGVSDVAPYHPTIINYSFDENGKLVKSVWKKE